MTEQEFISLHLNNGPLNTTGTINVNIDVQPGNLVGIVTGITVTYKPQIFPDTVFTDLERVLEEVTSIKFRVGAVQYSLRIQERRGYLNINENYSFYYFKVVPFQFPYDPNSTISNDVSISFYPFLLGSKFTFSDYNPIIDNVLEQRRAPSGSRIVESDRNNTTIAPSNLNAILSGSAKLATIQGSNYTTTGWSNGRYDGSKTNAKNYGGVPSVLAGRTFSGAIYAFQVLDNYIASQSLSTRTLQDIFHTGKGLTPTYEVVSSSYGINPAIDINTNTVRMVKRPGVVTGSFDINTIIQIEQERMRVVNYYENSNGTFIDVDRGLFNTTAVSHISGSKVDIIAPTFLYTYDTIRRQQNPVTNAKVWVEETENIYYTDSFGAVVYRSDFNTTP
jgi:hypothetical protein